MREGFKNLSVWQKSYNLALMVYKATQSYPRTEQYGLISQMRRASLSISGNIAEGYERQHRREYVQFLAIARGSLGELETYVLFSRDLGYLNEEGYGEIEGRRREVSLLLRALIGSLRY